jgi:hypothetical protein
VDDFDHLVCIIEVELAEEDLVDLPSNGVRGLAVTWTPVGR